MKHQGVQESSEDKTEIVADDPRVLVVAMGNWYGIARFPKALSLAGFKVASLCAERSFLAATRYLDQQFHWRLPARMSMLKERLSSVFAEWQPTLLIPGDQESVRFMRSMLAHEDISPIVRETIVRSIGRPEGVDTAFSKIRLLSLAQEMGLPVPTRASPEQEEPFAFARRIGYPVVVKLEYGTAGTGVRICPNETTLKQTIATLEEKSPAVRYEIQQYVTGKSQAVSLVANEGTVLAAFACTKTCMHPARTGPSTRIRFVEEPEMVDMASRLVSRLGLSGFASFDFIQEPTTREALLLECNPRPVPFAHLGALAGRDLAAAWHERLTGKQAPQAKDPPAPQSEIALFPQEWLRYSGSPYCSGTGLHDVPWDDPDLLGAYIRHGVRQVHAVTAAAQKAREAGALQ